MERESKRERERERETERERRKEQTRQGKNGVKFSCKNYMTEYMIKRNYSFLPTIFTFILNFVGKTYP